MTGLIGQFFLIFFLPAVVSAQQPTLTFSFPLPNRTAFTAVINTVFDHSMDEPYCSDDDVVAYTGETARRQYGISTFSVNFGCGAEYGFKNEFSSNFKVNGNYSGGQFLFYDGHPGYDYRTVDQSPDGRINVLAAADGTVISAGGNFNTIVIDHGNSYTTHYLHLSQFLVTSGHVRRGQAIGISGDAGVPGSPHLHFEVRLNDVPVDPYGWLGSGPDPYARARNINLWAPTYSVIDLGTLGGSLSVAHAINNAGQVVGEADKADGTRRAFLWTNNITGMRDLNTSVSPSIALGINSLAQVVGVQGNPCIGASDPFLSNSDNRNIVQVLPVGGNHFGGAAAINDFGWVAGNAVLGGPGAQAVYWTPPYTGIQSISTPSSSATSINNNGEIVGTTQQFGSFLAFLWSSSDPIRSLGTVPGGSRSNANAINNLKQVAGLADLGHAMRWTSADGMTDLGTLGTGSTSIAWGINNLGQIVGGSSTSGSDAFFSVCTNAQFGSTTVSAGSKHAFLWTPTTPGATTGTMMDLNTEISDPSWVLQEALGINDNGQIVGYGLHNGQTRAFLLTQEFQIFSGGKNHFGTEPSIAADPRNSSHAVVAFNEVIGDPNGGTSLSIKCSWAETFDGGATWTNPPGSLSLPGGFQPSGDPWIRYDLQGNLFYSCMGTSTPVFQLFPEQTAAVFVARSSTGLAKDLPPLQTPVVSAISGFNAQELEDHPAIAVMKGPSAAGRIVLCWSDTRRTTTVVNGRAIKAITSSFIKAAYSDDGQSWIEIPTPLGVGQVCTIGGSQTQLLITWFDYRTNMLVSRSSTDGANWFTQPMPVPIDSVGTLVSITDCSLCSPPQSTTNLVSSVPYALAVPGKDFVKVIWQRNSNGISQVFFGRPGIPGAPPLGDVHTEKFASSAKSVARFRFG